MENPAVQSAEELHEEEVHQAYERWMEEREREDLCLELHKLSFNHFPDNENDVPERKKQILGCFYCLEVYTGDEIHRDDVLHDGNKQTVLCPSCSVDSILFKYRVDKLTQMDFKDVLVMMKERWFDEDKFVMAGNNDLVPPHIMISPHMMIKRTYEQ